MPDLQGRIRHSRHPPLSSAIHAAHCNAPYVFSKIGQQEMTRAKHYWLYVLAGTLAYWVPDILIHLIQPPQTIWIVLLTFLVPAVVFVICRHLSMQSAHFRFQVSIPLFMLLGIWLFGPLGLAIGAISSGGKFLEADQIGSFFELWAMFPITTFIGSTYSGSLGGLGITTLILLIAAAVAAISKRRYD